MINRSQGMVLMGRLPVLRETEKAVQLLIDGKAEWIPIRQANVEDVRIENGQKTAKVVLSAFIASQKGFCI